MGISCRDLELLLRLRRNRHIPKRGGVIELGAQQLSHDVLAARQLLADLRREFGAGLPPPVPEPSSPPNFDGHDVRLDPNAPAARELWQWLGYSYAAVDFDGHPDTMPLDLNFDQVPESKRGRFAIVTNYGTTEHVANQLNAFKVIHDLASCDGVMIHTLPTQGHVNHGLVNYNMKFFWKLAQANEYKWLYANVYASAIVHEIPENVFACIEQWEPEVATTMREYRLRETTLVTVLRKTSTAPFVPPFDKPDGMSQETDDANLLTRYPTIFRPKH